MNKIFKSLCVISVGLVLLSCGASEKNDLAGELDDALASLDLDASKYEGKLDQLLTLDMAASVSGLPKDEAKERYSTTMKNPIYHDVRYEWKSDRTRRVKMMGSDMEIPIQNSISLSWVKSTTLEQFNRDYHNPTKEELANAKAAMNAKERELVQEGKATQEQMNSAGGMVDDLMEGYKVIDVPNLGEKAVWVQRNVENNLKVYYKGIEFQLTVDLSNDESSNKAKAIELAKQVIKKL